MHRRNERAVRANEHVIAESHRTHVQNDQVEVGVAAFAEAGIAAVVKLQRPLQKCVLSAIGQKLCQNGFAFFGIGFQCVVVLPKGTNTELTFQTEKTGEDSLMTAKNKWLIAHEDAKIAGAFNGLKGENITID